MVAPGFGYNSHIGFGKELIWGTKVTPTKFLCVNSGADGLGVEENRLESACVRNIFSDKDKMKQGGIIVAGEEGFDARYEGMGLLLRQALGMVSTLEVAVFVVAATNKYIEFKEDAGAELIATIPEATYKMGERGHYEIDATNNKIDFKEDAGGELTATLVAAEYADAAALAAQIKTQMEVVGAGTYTIAFSATTNRFTITLSGVAVSTFQILWKTGTNGADGNDIAPHDELGFLDNADGVDAVSDVSDYNTFDPSGTLCAEIKTQMEAVGTGTFTITFSNSTKLITIAIAGVPTTVQCLWKTGAVHGSVNADDHIGTLIGFDDTADSTDATSNVATIAVATAFSHVFNLTDTLPAGLTVEIDRDITAFTAEGCKINTLKFDVSNTGFLVCTVGFIGEYVSTGTATDPTGKFPTADLIVFSEGKFEWGAGSEAFITVGSITLNNMLSTDRRFVGLRIIKEPHRTAKIEVTGNVTTEFETSALYDDFRDAQERAVKFLFEGEIINATQKYTFQIDCANSRLTGGVPKVDNEGVVHIEAPFKAYAADADTREMSITLVNTISSIEK